MRPHPTPTNTHHLEILNTLITQGASLATLIHDRATAATPTDENRPGADPTVAFDRIARAIRRTIALVRHIEAHAATAPDPAGRAIARTQIIRGVEDAIYRRRNDVNTDPLYLELNERLDDPALDLDLANRSVDDIIEEIARDLGVAVQARAWVWKRRTPNDIAAIRQRAGFHIVETADRRAEAGPVPSAPPCLLRG